MTTPADELRAAAQTLLDLADETDEEINTNAYWHSEFAPREQWFANGIDNACGGPAGKLAGLLDPATARAIAAWLRTAGEHCGAHYLCCDNGPCSETAKPALAVTRAINGGTR
ncbi:hypothetical protein GCM10010317_077600 [Streptomyces mirabilis]|uniref:hypothetical protein n=1 Tax=Streptomyces mirabilis TaxID=68239 RepID=UPI00167DB6AC|nr:hypothetical protein [Streptomyces mirabilis]GHD70383.1 hypothetical protein GCM10010317_077600 [Streptomyces mirabilis]